MKTFPASAYWSNAGRTEAEQKDWGENFLASTKQLPGGAVEAALTLSGDDVTPPDSYSAVLTISAQTGTADDLRHIAQTNTPDGAMLFLRAAGGHTITVKPAVGGAGQITLATAADYALAGTARLLVQRTGTSWTEVTRTYGDQATALKSFYNVAGLGQNTFTGRQEWDYGAGLSNTTGTLTLGTDGNAFRVNSTVPLAALSSAPIGTRILLIFNDYTTVVDGASTIILAGRAPTVMYPGATLEVVSEGAGIWREITPPNVTRVLDRIRTNTGPGNTTAETAMYSFTVTAGMLGIDRTLRLRLIVSMRNVDGQATAGSPVLTTIFRAYYGGVFIAQLNVVDSQWNGSSADTIPDGLTFLLDLNLTEKNDPALQTTTMQMQGAPPIPLMLLGVGVPVGNSVTHTNVNSLANQSLAVTAQMGSAGANHSVAVVGGTLELL